MLGDARQRGFSLIELMIVIAILAIFLAIAIPSFRSFLISLQIRNTAESILNGLQIARAEAIRRNVSIQFVLGTNSGAYTKAWQIQTEGGTIIQSRSAGDSSVNVQLGVLPNNATTITFNGLGRRAANSDASVPAKIIDVDVPTTVLPAAQSSDLRITVLSGGLVKMCDPNISSSTDPRYCSCDPSISDTSNARYCS